MNRFKSVIYRIFLLILTLSLSFLYPHIRTIHKTEVDPFITMKDFDCSTNNTVESFIGKAKFKWHIGDAYSARLNCDDTASHLLDFIIYEWENEEIAEKFYKDKVSLIRQDYLAQRSGSYGTDTVVPKLPYEQTIEYMFKLDLKEWDIDNGYSIIDVHEILPSLTSLNYIVLIEDTKVMVIEYSDNLFNELKNIEAINQFLKQDIFK